MEHERLLATLGLTLHNPNPNEVLEVNRADPVNIIKLAEDNSAEEKKKLRTAEFELRAKSMGITGEESIAQKVAIWEGMWAAQQSGDDIGVSIIFSLLLRGYGRIISD